MRIAVVLFVAMISTCMHGQDRDTTLKSLYEGHRWFELREEVANTHAPIFYKAAVEAAFNQAPQAERDLEAVLRSPADRERVWEAQQLLLGLYFRLGKYRKASEQAQLMLTQKPDATDIRNIAPILQVLSTVQDQRVISEARAPASIDIEDKNIFLPVKVNGVEAHYILDNGFSLSGMSTSEAKRLNLHIHDVATNIDTMNGTKVNVRIAVVDDLDIAGVHLANVAFYVVPDEQPPFDQLEKGQQGILGLPVTIALNRFQWNPGARSFTVLPPSRRVNPTEGNLAFDGTSVFDRLDFRKRALNFSLDLGAQNTVLYPAFAHDFPDLAAIGSPETHKVTGVGGSTQIGSIVLRSLTFDVGGREVFLKPAHILLQDNNSTASWFAGNLGMDLLNQARTIEVDFSAMKISLR